MTLRQQLAEARASLRTAKDALETAKTVATLEVGGKNEAERKSNAALALLNDHAYAYALVYVRDCEALVERVEAEIEEEAYTLRLREVAARERLAEALLGRRTDDGVMDTLTNALSDYQRHNDYQGTVPDQIRNVLEQHDWYKR